MGYRRWPALSQLQSRRSANLAERYSRLCPLGADELAGAFGVSFGFLLMARAEFVRSRR
ncbi:hypothetical protein RHIZ404_220587 [Rhizobium sp. EC-SD404]|nr:hypothetical protein RHIZ404_220587 [Rhizobium sp. EC-SD404]